MPGPAINLRDPMKTFKKLFLFFPVEFLLCMFSRQLPGVYMCVTGRRGGGPMACSVCAVGEDIAGRRDFLSSDTVRDTVDFHFLSFIDPFPHCLFCTHGVGQTATGSRDGEVSGFTPLQRLPTS